MKRPEEVFTPRTSVVNPSMYVHRANYESDLIQAIRETKHIIIYGESGSGKSWLARKVFQDNSIAYLNCNMANASRFNSITEEFRNTVEREYEKVLETITKTSKSEGEASANNKFSIPFIGKIGAALRALFSREKAKYYRVMQKEPVERTFEFLFLKGKKKTNCLVIDNFESIIDSDALLRELSNIILLLDDERYDRYKTKLVIIGTPFNVLTLISSVNTSRPVANRLRQLPEIKPMTPEQVLELMRRGLEVELGLDVPSLQSLRDHVMFLTLGIPERVHEYCLELAKLSFERRVVHAVNIPIADQKWISNNHADLYTVIKSTMNSRDTDTGRRNQVIYTVGMMDRLDFKYNEVEDELRVLFPTSTEGKTLNVSGILSELVGKDRPILRRNSTGDGYVFTDTKYKLCIRSVLRLEEDERVKIREIGDV